MAELHPIGTPRPDAKGDVVFVHGLGGHWRETWLHAEGCWPEWLAADLPEVNVALVDYDSAISGWHRPSMPLPWRAKNLAHLLATKGIGNRPLVFVCHSLGGLVVKKLLQQSHGDKHHGELVTATRGIVFLGVPNAGADIASWGVRIRLWLGPLGGLARVSPVITELRANETNLLDLRNWFADRAADLDIETEIYYETHAVRGLVHVVNEASADLGIGGVLRVPIDADHFDLCKLKSQTDSTYESIFCFVRRQMTRSHLPKIIHVPVPPHVFREIISLIAPNRIENTNGLSVLLSGGSNVPR